MACGPYIQSVKKWCPEADIVSDLFHVVRAFNRVIDDIRNEEFRKAKRGDKTILKGSKYPSPKTWIRLKRYRRARLKEILAVNKRLNTVYRLKRFLKRLWEYHIPGWAEGAPAEWCNVASQDAHRDFVRFARTLQPYQYGIVNHCKHQMHTSRFDGVHNRIKVIKRVAYGFHDPGCSAVNVKQELPGREWSN
ncbi:MAG: transposase [Phycisphaerae bacterium]|nr:transposase [Phycisphaerae bacterium]